MLGFEESLCMLAVGIPACMERHPDTWEPRNHRWDSVPVEGYTETQEPRNHSAFRGSLLSRGRRCSIEGGYPWLL